MKKLLLISGLVLALTGNVYSQINSDTSVNSDFPGGGGMGGGGLSEADIDTIAELNAIIAPDVIDLSSIQTLTNKVIDANGNTVKILRHATDCTTFTAAVDGQYCWEQDSDVLYVCETADVCDTAGEWDPAATGSITVEESDDNPSVFPTGTIQFNASHFTVADETGGQVQVNSILSPLATALAANGANCSAGNFPLGVDASGAVESCTDVVLPGEIDTLSELATLSNFTLSGNTTKLTTTTGTLTSNHCVKIDASGNLVDAGDVCGTGGGGTNITLDIGDDGGNDSSAINEIATSGDTNSIITEPSADKMLIDMAQSWPKADALTSNPTDCSANQFATTIAANGNLTCASIVDADVPDTITASNYLLLTGGTLTGLLTTDNLGIEFDDSDTNPTCGAGNYNLFADLSETAMKVCNNGTAEVVTTPNNTQTLTNKTLSASNNVIQADTALALDANPSDCSANQFATTIAANGNLTCSAIVDADVPNDITINAAAALAANPVDCSSNQFANAIGANGDLTCAALVDADVPNTITASNYVLKAGDTMTGNLLIDNQTELRLGELDSNGTNYIGFRAVDSMGSNQTLTWNITAATCTGDSNGGALTINGSNEIVCSTDDGGGGAADITRVGTCTTGDCAIEGGNDMFPLLYEGTPNTFEVSIEVADPSADRTFTFPDVASGNVVMDTATQTLTNKTLAAANNVIDADTAVALASNPTDCTTDQFATTIAASGNLTCSQVAGSQVSNTPAGDLSSSTVQTAINELDNEKVSLAGDSMDGKLVLKSQSLTIADSGDGNHATDTATTITGNDLYVTCSDANGCDLTLSETNAAGNQALRVVNVSTNTLYLVNATATSIMCTGATISLGQYDSANFLYYLTPTSQWQQECKQVDWTDLVNVPAFRKALIQLRPQANEPPASSFATINTRNSHPALRFNGNVCAIWSFVMPNTYGGNGVTAEIWYTSTETSNDTDWDGSWDRIETTLDVDTADSSAFASAVSADNNNNSGTSGIATKVSIAFSNSQIDSCAAGEYCRFRICRDDTSDTGGADTIDFMIGDLKETP